MKAVTSRMTSVNECANSPLIARRNWQQQETTLCRRTQTKEALRAAPLKAMAGTSMRIYLKEVAQPFAIHTLHEFTSPWWPKISLLTPAKIHHLRVTLSLLWPKLTVVYASPPTCLSLTGRCHPTHLLPTPFAAKWRVDPKARYYTKVDAVCGYWQKRI